LTMKNTNALSQSSENRRYDADGRLHVMRSNISAAMVCPYFGREIPNNQALGLDPDKIYQLYRDPVELERAAATFERLPILSEHVQALDTTDRHDELRIGTVGSRVIFEPPFLVADLCFDRADAIAAIETKTVRELSCGYRYTVDMTAGEIDGQKYDGVMRDIIGNHLALVEFGRAGRDVVVGDEQPKIEEKPMKNSKLGRALIVSLGALSSAFAADTVLQRRIASAEPKNFNRADFSKSILACDAAIDAKKVDEIVDAILGVADEDEPEVAVDETPEGKIKSLLCGKVADDIINAICELMPKSHHEGMKPEDVKMAMDSLRAELRDAEAARREVRGVVGDVLGLDSAEQIYGFALDSMKVDRAEVSGAPALRALFRVAAKTKSEAVDNSVSNQQGIDSKLFSRFGRA